MIDSNKISNTVSGISASTNTYTLDTAGTTLTDIAHTYQNISFDYQQMLLDTATPLQMHINPGK